MRHRKHIALGLALLAAVALAAQAGADNGPWPDRAAVALTSDGPLGDGGPPSPGPTNPEAPAA